MTRRVNTSQPLRLHSRFHGRLPKVVMPADFAVPRDLVCLGQAIAVVYRCDKLNGGGDGTMAEYEHTSIDTLRDVLLEHNSYKESKRYRR